MVKDCFLAPAELLFTDFDNKVTILTCSTFSTMNTIKRKQTNRLTHAHLECPAMIATTNYKYNMKKVKDMQASFCSSQYEGKCGLN